MALSPLHRPTAPTIDRPDGRGRYTGAAAGDERVPLDRHFDGKDSPKTPRGGGTNLFPRRRAARQRHRWENSLAVGTFIAGLVAFVTGAIRETHLVAVCVGVVACLVGLYSQLVSATTGERWINVLGIGLAAVGIGLGLSHGGFTF
jgi:hypothetical protein